MEKMTYLSVLSRLILKMIQMDLRLEELKMQNVIRISACLN